MTNKLRLTWILSALLLTSLTARAALTLDEYRQWQAFNSLEIRSINFSGLHHFAESDLLNIMATEPSSWMRKSLPIGHRSQFYADDFAGDLFRLEHFYNRQGFLHARINGSVIPDKSRQIVHLKFDIQEGPPLVLTAWNMVKASNPEAFVDSIRWSKLMPIKMGKRLTLPDVQTSADTLAYKMKDFGYARARVTYNITRDSLTNTAQVTFTLYPGHYCFLGNTRFLGLRQFAEAAARRELTYKYAEPYALHKLEETRERLVNLDLFTLVTIRTDTTVSSDTLPVIVQVEEGRRYHVSGGVGYDNQQKERVTAEFRDLNFFGQARRFQWDGSYAELQRTMEVKFFWPHEPVHFTNITLNPKWEWQKFPNNAFRLETITNTTILSATPLRYVTTAIANEYGTARRRDIDSTGRAGKTRPIYLKSVETGSVSWDTRDNPLVPRRGHLISASISEEGAFYHTAVEWWRAIVQGSALVPSGRYVVLAGRARLGVIGPLRSSKETPIEERFYLGGPADVRGWRYRTLSPRTPVSNSVAGGNIAFNTTAEVRRNLKGPFTAVVFVDAGNVWSDVHRWRAYNLYPSAGVGLMVFTPVGPLRVDYAYQLRRNPYRDPRWNVDFSVGAAF